MRNDVHFAVGCTVEDADSIGEGTKVWRGAYIGRGAVIGTNCMIGQGVHIGPGVKIGNGCRIQNGAQLFEGVTLEENVFIGPHVVFTNILLPRAFVKHAGAFNQTLVKKGASIGANATILSGIEIGAFAMVGAGSVVTKPVPHHALVHGNPSRSAGTWVCDCGAKLNVYAGTGNPVYATCSACHARYDFDDTGPVRVK
jgi:UDP-2-acetamido-3-amino-2,3-dideoxy-glucuronate N-acetyltransferase